MGTTAEIGSALRATLRSLAKAPAFAATAVGTLALALAGVVTMLVVVHGVLLRPLPFPEPDRLVVLWDSVPQEGRDKWRVSGFNFHRWRQDNNHFEGLAAFGWATSALTGVGEPVQVTGSRVSEDYFPLLGVGAVHGRGLTRDDFQGAAAPVVVLSHSLWQRHLGADPSWVGRTVQLDGEPFTVVGVLPAQPMPMRATHAGRLETEASGPHF